MLNFQDAPKKPTNLSLNVRVVEEARAMGLNVSQTVDTLLANEVKRLYWERWNAQNKDAIEQYNREVQAHGLPLAKYRSWGQDLDDAAEQT